MAEKYQILDRQLLELLDDSRDRVLTTNEIFKDLGITSDTDKRHISRRVGQLREKGYLVCTLFGTTRQCRVVGILPNSLSKSKTDIESRGRPLVRIEAKSIEAEDSEDFKRKGGIIEVIPSIIDNTYKGAIPVGW